MRIRSAVTALVLTPALSSAAPVLPTPTPMQMP
jgi:hypothetical protein